MAPQPRHEMPKLLFFYRISCQKAIFGSKEVISIQRYETTDIFIGAFFLCKGGVLRGIRIKDPRRNLAAFEISGDNLELLDREYRTGQALVNPAHLRESLNLLRDMLFDLREMRPAPEPRGRKRRRDDRPRKDRRHQGLR